MSRQQPLTIWVWEYGFTEHELHQGLIFAEEALGLDALQRALGYDREVVTYHLCLASSRAFCHDSLEHLRRVAREAEEASHG